MKETDLQALIIRNFPLETEGIMKIPYSRQPAVSDIETT